MLPVRSVDLPPRRRHQTLHAVVTASQQDSAQHVDDDMHAAVDVFGRRVRVLPRLRERADAIQNVAARVVNGPYSEG